MWPYNILQILVVTNRGMGFGMTHYMGVEHMTWCNILKFFNFKILEVHKPLHFAVRSVKVSYRPLTAKNVMCHWTILQTISDSILRSKHYKMFQIQNIAKQCEENNGEEKWQKLDILKSHQVRHMLDHDNGKRDFLKSTQRRKIWGKMDKNIWILWKNLMKKGSLMWEWLLDWLIMFWFLLQLLLIADKGKHGIRDSFDRYWYKIHP